MFEMCYYALCISLAENVNLDKSTASRFHLILSYYSWKSLPKQSIQLEKTPTNQQSGRGVLPKDW